MAAISQTYTPEETYALINSIATEKSDRFLVRVMRRRGAAGLYDNVATLADATVQQIASAETWLPRLAGGGEYGLRVAHIDASHVNIGCMLPFPLHQLPPMAVADISAVNAADWTGPSTCVYPKAADVQAMNAARSTVGSPTQVIAGSQQPAPQGGFNPAMLPQAQLPGIPAGYVSQAAADEYARREKELAAREARLAADMQAREDGVKRAEMEQRIRTENENRTRALEGQLGELKALLVQQAQAKPAPEGFSVDKLITALTPALGAFMASQQSSRAEMVAMQKAASDQNAEMLKSFMNKPAISPEILTILEVNKAQSAAQAEMMNHVFTAMKGVSAMSVQMIETVADLQLGQQPEGSPVIDAVREAVKGFAEMQRGVGNSGRKIAQQASLPPPKLPVPVPVTTYQQAARAPAAQPIRPAPNGQATPQAPQTLVRPQVEPVPNQPPAFDGVNQPQPQPVVQPKEIDTSKLPADVNALDVLEHLIRNRTQPVEEVAAFFVASADRPEVIAGLQEYNGEINALIGERLGDWLVAESVNRDYLGELGKHVDRLGEEAGIFEPEEGDEPEEEKAAES